MWQILVYFAEFFCKRVKHKPIDENESSAHYQAELTALSKGKKVGLVSYNGCFLHAGHASLVKRSVVRMV